MYTFVKIQNFLFQLKDRLLENENIKKMLYYTVPNALDLTSIGKDDAAEFITLTPIIEDENGIAKSYRNVFIAIYLGDIIPQDTENDITFRIAVYANKENYELENKKIRPIEIMKEVFSEINGLKFEFSGKIIPINVIAENLIRGNFSGFVSTWNVVDSYEIIWT